MKVTPLDQPLPGEHLTATFPVMQPETEDARWRQRINFWAGRALTESALELEQNNRAGRLSWVGRLGTPGIVAGLDAVLEPPSTPQSTLGRTGYFVHVLPGHGIRPDGDDVIVARPLRIPLEQIPVQYVRVSGPGHDAEGVPADATAVDPINAGGFIFNVDTFTPAHDPWAAVLVMCPVDFNVFAKSDPTSPCELDLSQDPFSDERRLDACELRLCQLPAAWQALPQLTDRNSPSYRNRLASVVFGQEISNSNRQLIRRVTRTDGTPHWDTLLKLADVFPWELLGVPLAMFSSEQPASGARVYFLDRATVVRPGGLARARTRPASRLATDANAAALNPPGSGTPIMWRARVDQFVEQLGLLPANTEADVQALSARFQFLPPIGFLPRPALTLLTTTQAQALPQVAGKAPDRAGTNHFFPAAYTVDAVPVAVEDLDTALASSVALTPYDTSDATAKESVRVLVPVPQQLFDPNLLVVEQEDPIFAETLGRFVAARQDWRQRRDFVRTQLTALSKLIDGPAPALSRSALEPGQVEPEPTEALDQNKKLDGFSTALLSPSATTPPWELTVTFAGAHPIAADTILFLLMRVDAENTPSQVQVQWQTAAGPLPFTWTSPPDPPLEQLNQTGQPQATPLWQRFDVTSVQLHVTSGSATGLLLHIGDGRLVIAAAGRVVPGSSPGTTSLEFWWQAGDAAPAAVKFTNGDWSTITDVQLLAPFEDFYRAFPDADSQTTAIKEIDSALNPAGVSPRSVPMSVDTNGIQAMLAEMTSEADEADDFIDAHFTRAQTNLYRVRKLVLGETAAQRLLINPAIATIADAETATASAQQLGSFLSAAKLRVVTKDAVNATINPPANPSIAPVAAALGVAVVRKVGGTPNPIVVKTASGAAGGSAGGRVTKTGGAAGRSGGGAKAGGVTGGTSRIDIVAEKIDVQEAGPLREILGDRPESGPTLPPRGLSIGQRFVEPPATDYLSYARSSLTLMLDQLRFVRLPLVGQTVRSLDQKNTVSLVDLQGRAVPQPPAPPAAGKTSEDFRQAALTTLLTVPPVQKDTDEAEVTLAAMDYIELQSAILRTIESSTGARRSVIDDGTATFTAISDQRGLASDRVLTLEGKLAEARQDVGVARALRQEEQQRVASVNDQRDSVIRDEVKFLAYVRPRTVDATRREIQYWTLDGFGDDQAVPVCLRQHDDPPAELNTYLQLMRHAPARWFTAIAPLITKLDTPDKLIALLNGARTAALSFAALDTAGDVRTSAAAVQFTVLGAQQVIARIRTRTPSIDVGDRNSQRWTDFQRDALQYAAIGDLIDGQHGSHDVSVAAASELNQIAQIATCLYVEFGAAPPTLRLAWVEQFSQFDRPAPLRDLTILPQFGRLDRTSRRRLQQLVDWLFGRVSGEDDAVSLVNDLVRLCLLLASHAPVNRIIAGHVPAPTPVRTGVSIPIRPLNPNLVRVGMEFHVWQASRVVASGHVEDLQPDEVSARVETLEARTTTLDSSMRVQFIPSALGLMR